MNKSDPETVRRSASTVEARPRHRARGLAPQVARLLLRFVELQIPMGLGALVCYLLGRLIPASSGFAAVYHPGTYLFAAGDILFLTVPVVAWMIFRGHRLRHGLEMAVALNAPVAAVIVLGELTGLAYLLWLITAMYPAMSLGMLVYLLHRRDHFTGRTGHSAAFAQRMT